MNAVKEKKRWPIALVVISAVVLVSAAMIYSFRDAPGRIPVQAISDDSNGVIVVWQNEDGIYAQRVDSSGQIKWSRGGVFIAACPPGSGYNLMSDSQGGAIITWNDTSGRPGDHDDPTYFDPVPFHSQRISVGGKLLWSDSLVASGAKWQVVSDGTGGAIFAWNNYQTYSRALHDDFLHLQRIAPDGTRLCGNKGELVVASSPFRAVTPEETASGVKGTSTHSRPTYEGTHYIVTDGAGGVIVLWEEDTGSEDDFVYAQRLNSEGNYVWPDKVTTAATSLLSAESDGDGGVKIGTPQLTNTSAGMVRVYAHIGGDGEVLPTSEWVPGVTSTYRRRPRWQLPSHGG